MTSTSLRGRAAALITILAIAGTLGGCGRYGKPVRPTPPPEERTELGASIALPVPATPGDPRA